MSLDAPRAAKLDKQRRGFVGPIRLSRYTQPQDALSLTEELIHLETQARIPADLDLSWLAPALQRPGFDLVTASVGGRLAGFVVANLKQDIVLSRLVVASAAFAEIYPPRPPQSGPGTLGPVGASEDASIRPSPSGCHLGGVARVTREAMVVVEATGFDVVRVETVGVGQSEGAVSRHGRHPYPGRRAPLQRGSYDSRGPRSACRLR